MTLNSVTNLFNFDLLAILMTVLIVFVSLTVATFAMRYIKGDTKYSKFFLLIGLLVSSLIFMVSADNLVVFLLAWGCCNATLVLLMINKSTWRAAKASGILAAKMYFIGFAFIASGFFLLYSITGQSSIQLINNYDFNNHNENSPFIICALLFLLVGAMIQSAIWPFHKWLISSLNSPTPVSAIMHAGLVNGGGFLLIRFAPLYLDYPIILTIIFAIGLSTAIIGTLFKLVQNDIKRMLACSTMAQMGFMMAQIGLGLFSAALAHLCYHGLFKAYLFLTSGGAAQEKRVVLDYPPSKISFCCALLCGIVGSYSFAWVGNKAWISYDTNLLIVFIAFVASSQCALSILARNSIKILPLAMIAAIIVGGVYGLSIHLIESFMLPMNLIWSQPINAVHIFGIALLFASWLAVLFVRNLNGQISQPRWIIRLYVKVVNASQPNPDTVTTHRNQYKYL